MRIQKQCAAICEAIDVWSPRLRVSAQTTDPVVLIINYNHHNIRSRPWRSRWLSRSSYLAGKQTNRTQNESRDPANRDPFLMATVPMLSLPVNMLNTAKCLFEICSLRNGNSVDRTAQNPLAHQNHDTLPL